MNSPAIEEAIAAREAVKAELRKLEERERQYAEALAGRKLLPSDMMPLYPNPQGKPRLLH